MTGSQISTVASCANCHAVLNGPYCGVCGQRHEPHIHSIGEFLNEATESLTHADSRLWRTLWLLLFKPGFLTREFLEGRRARYLPPFRLYLVLSVVMFIVAASGSHNSPLLNVSEDRVGIAGTDFELDRRGAEPIPGVKVVTVNPKNTAETPEQRATRICKDSSYGGPWRKQLEPRVKNACHAIALDNGRELMQQLNHNIPRALFILLPLLALVMRLMYLRRYYVEHLLFFVHNHAFTFLIFTLYLLAIRLITGGWFFGILTALLVLGVPYYTYRAMLRVYGQGRWVTRAKFSVLVLAYLICSVLMALLTSLYTFITL